MQKIGKTLVSFTLGLILILVAACTPTLAPEDVTPTTPSEPAITEGKGIIEFRVTDPPPADVSSAVVYLSNIEAHRVSDNSSEWIVISANVSSFDLMDVIGVSEVLAAVEVEAASFTQIRMDVERVDVVTVGGDNITAEVPGGKLKIVRSFNVQPGMKTILTLDFDGEKSLILRGGGGAGNKTALFKPVVKLLVEKEKIEAEQEQEQEQEGGGASGNQSANSQKKE